MPRSDERGHANHGWLDSHFTFSFADYYAPAHMGFRSLRVINQDRIAPGGGFPTHPHRDMEIFSYLVEGELQHQDSLGNGRVLKPGQIQMMCAGKGVLHSEFNPSDSEISHLLQIWIQPDQRGLVPSYTEWHPKPEHETAEKVLVISSDGREGSATIHQDADISSGGQCRLPDPGGHTAAPFSRGMAHIEPEHVGPGQDQFLEGFEGISGRAKGGDDFGFAQHGAEGSQNHAAC